MRWSQGRSRSAEGHNIGTVVFMENCGHFTAAQLQKIFTLVGQLSVLEKLFHKSQEAIVVSGKTRDWRKRNYLVIDGMNVYRQLSL